MRPSTYFENRQQQPVLYKVLNSGIAAIFSTLMLYPFDVAKTRIQNQRSSKDAPQPYSSMRDCLRKIHKLEGFRGLYRGCFVSILFIAPEKTVKLVSNDFFRQCLKGEAEKLSLPREVLAGAAAGVCQSFISTPMELMKVNLQDAGRIAAMTNSKIGPISARTIAMDLIRRKGILGMFQGIQATGFRNSFFSLVYFPVFFSVANLDPWKIEGSPHSTSSWAFVGGFVAGGFGAAAATPFDVVKTRTQRIKLAKSDVAYNSLTHALTTIYKTEGAAALMKGSLIRMSTIAPYFGILQAVYYLEVGQRLVETIEDLESGDKKK